MMLKIFKPFLMIALLATAGPGFAQDTTTLVSKNGATIACSNGSDKTVRVLNFNVNVNTEHLEMALDHLNSSLNEGLANLNHGLRIISPEIKNITGSISISGKNHNEVMVSTADNGEHVRNYTKTYPMDANDRLEIDNTYGKVVVNTWNRNEVKVDIEIKSYADDDGTAQKMSNAISISDAKNGDVVSFKTSYNKGSGNSVWDLLNNRDDHHRMEVNYAIYMPSKNALNISDRYGSISLPDFDGRVSITSAYGSFSGKSLMHDDNQIDVRYGSVSIGALSSADVSVKYGSIELGSVNKLNLDIKNSSGHIGKVKSSGNINAKYAGTVQVDNLDKNFNDFSFSGGYSNIKIGLDNAVNTTFDVTVRYGDFNYGGLPVTITEKTPSDDSKGWKPTKNFKGHIGKGSSERMINISTSYGSASFE